MEQKRLKTTGEIVYALANRGKHTYCLFPFQRVSKNGNRGVTQAVRTDRLEAIRRGYTYG